MSCVIELFGVDLILPAALSSPSSKDYDEVLYSIWDDNCFLCHQFIPVYVGGTMLSKAS